MHRITNKLCYNDSRLPLKDRLVTVEDGVSPQNQTSAVDFEEIPHQGSIYQKLIKLLQEVSAHITLNSNVSLTGGSFYFRLGDEITHGENGPEPARPVLLFAHGIKTDHPLKIMVATELRSVTHPCELQPILYDPEIAI